MHFYTSVSTYESYVLARGYDAKGRRVESDTLYRPTLYSLADSKSASGFTSIYNRPLEAHTFKNMKESRAWIKRNEEMLSFDMFGLTNYALRYIAERWPDIVPYDPAMINVLYMDIEVDSIGGFPHPDQAERMITAITLRQNGFDLVFGYQPYTPKTESVRYVQCADEIDLLRKFLRAYATLDPDIITGWKVNTFDIPYLVNRIVNLIGESTATMLSPWKIIERRTVRQKYGREATAYNLLGVQIVDYLEAYRKFRLKERENYRLDTIAEIELGENKLDFSEYASLNELYVKDHDKFIDYNIHDVALVERLDKKLRYIELVLRLAYRAKINYADTFHQTRIWDGLTNDFLTKQNMIVPHRKIGVKTEKYTGAYVKAPIIGRHRFVVSYDLTSLYPSLILQYNISPDTIVDRTSQFDLQGLIDGTWRVKSTHALAGNGYYFRKDKSGFMTNIIAGLFKARQDAKQKMLEAQRKHDTDDEAGWNTIQQVTKVVLNSCYGTMGTPYFRFFDLRLAEAITMSGQMVIQFVRDRLNRFLNEKAGTVGQDYVIASDTDSIYLKLEGIVHNEEEQVYFADHVIKDFLKSLFVEFAERTNAFNNFMDMKRETIASEAFWTAKKRYAMNVIYDESGKLDKPKVKIVGLEAIKTAAYPAWSCKKLTELITIILRGSEKEAQSFIRTAQNEFKTVPIESISSPIGISDLDKYVDEDGEAIKGTTQHAKAAITHNQMLSELGLETKYRPIQSGDKIKVVLLNTPNSLLQSKVIGFVNQCPPEFNASKYIDHEAQFEKVFLSPVETMMNAVGWSVTPKRTLAGTLKRKTK